VKAIVAMAENRVIGCEGKIPWHLPKDLRFFKEITWGKTIIMGRKTHVSIGRPLPGRKNIVISRRQQISPSSEIIYVPEPQTAIRICEKIDAFVIGGESIYKALLPWCDEIFVTYVTGFPKGDTFFPAFEKEFDTGVTLWENPQMKIVRHSRVSEKSREDS
jgi:dihydrofolate reductase